MSELNDIKDLLGALVKAQTELTQEIKQLTQDKQPEKITEEPPKKRRKPRKSKKKEEPAGST